MHDTDFDALPAWLRAPVRGPMFDLGQFTSSSSDTTAAEMESCVATATLRGNELDSLPPLLCRGHSRDCGRGKTSGAPASDASANDAVVGTFAKVHVRVQLLQDPGTGQPETRDKSLFILAQSVDLIEP